MNEIRQEQERGNAAYGKVMLFLLGSLVVMAAGFFLPSVLMDRQREALRNNMAWIQMEEDVGIVVTAQEAPADLIPLTTEDLLYAVGILNPYGNNVFYHEPLEGGMTKEQAVAQLGEELRQMASLSLIPEWCADVEGMQYTAVLGTLSYEERNVRGVNPRHEVWEIFLYSPELTIQADLHAASGKIFRFYATMGSRERNDASYQQIGGQQRSKAVTYMEDYLQPEPELKLTDQFVVEEGYAYLLYDAGGEADPVSVECGCYVEGEELYLSYSVF